MYINGKNKIVLGNDASVHERIFPRRTFRRVTFRRGIFVGSYTYIFTVRDLSIETDKIYRITRLLLKFLQQNIKMRIV